MSHLPCRPVRWALPVLLLLCACSSPTTTRSTSAAPSGEAGAVAATAQEYAALGPAARDAELRTVTGTLERELVTMSGLEAELGGAAPADAAYAAVSRALVGDLETATSAKTFGRFGAGVPVADEPSIAGLMFGNMVVSRLGVEAIISATNDLQPGKSDSRSTGSGPGDASKSSFTVSGSTQEAQLDAGSEITINGVKGTLKSVITVSPCPDPRGEFTATTTMTAAVSSTGGRTGSNLNIELVIKGQVDDDAHLVSYDVDTRTQSASFEKSKGQYVDQTSGWSVTGTTTGGYRGSITRTGGQVTEAFVAEQRSWAVMTAVLMQDKTIDSSRQAWESGRCVALKATTQPGKRTGLDPSASLKLLAAARSKVDGAPAGGTVTATMSGSTSVAPSGSKVPADATFTVIAPGAKDQKATVALEARSRRGVAKAEVAVDTKAGSYTASGKAGNLTFSGTVPDLTKPFTVNGAGGASVAFTYTPTSADGRKGTMRYTGNTAGFKLSGSGTYTVTGADGGPLTLTQTATSCKAGPLGCTGGAATITLTPAG